MWGTFESWKKKLLTSPFQHFQERKGAISLEFVHDRHDLIEVLISLVLFLNCLSFSIDDVIRKVFMLLDIELLH